MNQRSLSFPAPGFFALSAALLLGAPFANAEEKAGNPESTGASDLSLEEIFNLDANVTIASLFKEPEILAGSSVSIIHAPQWRRGFANYTLQALERTPGVMFYHDGGNYQFVVRGFTSATSSRGLATSLDGVPLNSLSFSTALNNIPNFGLPLLESIEMIRGPGSTIYGSDAFSGAIAMKTWTPEKDGYQGEFTYGNFGTLRAGLKASRELLSGWRLTLGGAVDGLSNQELTFNYPRQALTGPTSVRTVGTGSFTETRNGTGQSVYAKLLNGKTEAAFYFNSRFEDGTRPETPIKLNVLNEQRRNLSRFSMAKVSNSFSMPSQLELDSQLYFWGTSRFVDDVNKDTGALDATTATPEERGGASVYLKHARTDDFPVQWLAGYQFDWFRTGEATGFIDPAGGQAAFGAGNYVPGLANRIRRVHGLLVQTDTLVWGDSLHVLAGGRYDFYLDEASHFSPRAGLIFAPNSSTSYKLLYSHAFRAASGAEKFSPNPLFRSNPDLNPEKIDTYEFIWMNKSPTYSVTWNLFYSDWSDGINLVSQQYQNLSKLHSYGSELEGKVFLLDGKLGLTGSASYVRSANITSNRAEFTGFPLWVINTGANYRWAQPKLDFSLSGRHQLNQTLGTTPSSGAMEDLFRLDFFAGWDLGHALLNQAPGSLELSLQIRNLMNASISSSSPLDYSNGLPEPGRNVLLTMRGQL